MELFCIYSILFFLISMLINIVNGQAKVNDATCVDPSKTANYALGNYII